MQQANKDIFIPSGTCFLRREQMPQIARADIPEYIEFLRAKRIKVTQTEVNVNSLRATQSDINKTKILDLISNPPSNKPLIVSNDNQVLDGHHTWLAKLNSTPDCNIGAFVVDLNINELINISNQFPKTFRRSVHEATVTMQKETILEKVSKILKEKKKKKVAKKKFEKVIIEPEVSPNGFTQPASYLKYIKSNKQRGI